MIILLGVIEICGAYYQVTHGIRKIDSYSDFGLDGVEDAFEAALSNGGLRCD